MNLNCAILHADGEVVRKLEEYIGKVPFLSLCGTYDNPLEALKDYYEMKVEIYFIGICASEEEGVGGMDFSRMLSLPTRVIFVADTGRYARVLYLLTGRREEHFRPQMLVDEVRVLLTELGLPTCLSAVGVTEEAIPHMAADAMKSGNVLANPRQSVQRDLEALYRKAM